MLSINPNTYDVEISTGDTYYLIFNFGTNSAFANATLYAAVKRSPAVSKRLMESSAVVQGRGGLFTAELPISAVSNELAPGNYVWDVKMKMPSGENEYQTLFDTAEFVVKSAVVDYNTAVSIQG